MRIPSKKAQWIASHTVSDGLVDTLCGLLGRGLHEDEGEDLQFRIIDAVAEVIADFEFVDPEPTPIIERDPPTDWVRGHLGHSFRRPKGSVVYTVVGSTRMRVGFQRYEVPVVRRSSDDEEQPMWIKELRNMVEVPPESS